jgi:hypothetical protein
MKPAPLPQGGRTEGSLTLISRGCFDEVPAFQLKLTGVMLKPAGNRRPGR